MLTHCLHLSRNSLALNFHSGISSSFFLTRLWLSSTSSGPNHGARTSSSTTVSSKIPAFDASPLSMAPNTSTSWLKLEFLGTTSAGKRRNSSPGWRRKPRWTTPSQASQRGSDLKEGKMGSGCQRKNLQQAGEAPADCEPVQSQIGELRRRCESELRELLPRWEHPSAPRLSTESAAVFVSRLFVSLFGGVANPAKFWAQHGGLAAAVFDFADSPANDLSKHSVWNRIYGLTDSFGFGLWRRSSLQHLVTCQKSSTLVEIA